MDFVSLTMSHWAFGLGLIFLTTSIGVLVLNKAKREAVLARFNINRRRLSGASTPPRSLSPSKKASTSTSEKPSYLTTFPPSRREALPELAKTTSAANVQIIQSQPTTKDFLQKSPLPMTESYNSPNAPVRYTPTGFSTSEIKAMGDFPAYDILSGVPLPEPYENFDIKTALPRPYRPFRWAYHQTMSFNKMETDWWLEVESSYVSTIKKRQDLFKQYGSMVLDYLPGSELVCKELMEMCLQFYCARYPSLFSLSDNNRIFHNRILDTKTEIKRFHPLHILLNNVPEDFAIVLRNEEDGHYYMRAGVICSSLGWNVGTKIGLRLDAIHEPIPDYKEKMSFSMDRFFSKLNTNSPIQRGSWGLEVGTPLFMPPGDPHELLREQQDPELDVGDCYLRVDWQTLRRLPLSAGVVFNFTALFTRVEEMRAEKGVPALLNEVLKKGKESLMKYKGTWHVEHVVVPKLEEWAEEQVRDGLVSREWEVGTLAESPFYEGWEEKWHKAQGF